MSRRDRIGWRTAIIAVLAFVAAGNVAIAGGGPENVALVVNQDSWASLTVANRYATLRQIPARNVIYLSGKHLAWHTVSIDTFRDEILIPVIEELGRRELQSQIDYIVYSADFPTAIDVRSDLAEGQAKSLPKYITPKASINGLTYLYEAVLAKNWRAYLSLQTNAYAKAQGRGFSSRYGWSSDGRSVDPADGRRYILSTVLAVTSGRGNSMSEVAHYLDRSAAADGTRPKGTIYLMENDNVRSETREWAFRDTVNGLARLRVDARIEKGTIPSKHDDVMGAVVGTAKFDWSRHESAILPGAICEHLTSFGGDLRARASQTPLTEFLRHGAAGASGTVTEPYAIQAKFPTPLIHVSYASGCSLAESFYQSIAGPYQLLIVGDPLCQPWAQPPAVSVAGIQPGEVVRGRGMIKVAAGGQSQPVKRIELYLDGRRVGVYPARFSFPVDTRMIWDGPHELRVVAIADDAAETQGRAIVPFTVANGQPGAGGRPGNWVVKASDQKPVHGSNLEVACLFPKAESIGILSGTRRIGKIDGNSGTLSVPTEHLGSGNVPLRVVAYRGDREIAEQGLAVDVQLPTVRPLDKPPEGLDRGLLWRTRVDAQVVPNLEALSKKLRPDQDFSIQTYFEATDAGTYQLQFRPQAGIASVHLNKHAIRLKRSTHASSYPIQLVPGWYELRITGKTSEQGIPDIRFGDSHVLPLAADRLWCAAVEGLRPRQ